MEFELLKIGYFADGEWSHLAFKRMIVDNSIRICFVCARFDTDDDTLKKYCEEYNIEYLIHKNVNSADFINYVAKFHCDLFVSMSFNQIFKSEIINLPSMKTINCHAGKLPFYRGRNILNWALINDEKDFGITVHFVDQGIDTGDIILQRTFPIKDSDNYRTLLELAFKECANILYVAIKSIQTNTYKPVKQKNIHPVGFYCGVRSTGDEIINWNQNSREIFNFIRAICDPGPRATTFSNGREIKINNARLIKNAPGYISAVGQIIRKSNDVFIVKTKNSSIEISGVESEVTLKIGDRLG